MEHGDARQLQARYFTKEAEEKIKAAGRLPSARSGRGPTWMHLLRWCVRAVCLEPVGFAVRSLGVESVHQKAESARSPAENLRLIVRQRKCQRDPIFSHVLSCQVSVEFNPPLP